MIEREEEKVQFPYSIHMFMKIDWEELIDGRE